MACAGVRRRGDVDHHRFTANESRRTAGVQMTGPLFPHPPGKTRGAKRAGTPGYPMIEL